MKTIFFHIDVNSAFLSWSAVEKLHNSNISDALDLRLVPSIIGGDMERRHGVVLAKSSPAKTFGIVTGEPIVSAMRKCPCLIIEAPNHPLYEQYSHNLMQFLLSFCPDMEQLSIDECFMDFSSVSSFYPSAVDAAVRIKDSVYEKFGFTVNIGVSDKKILAKMASDFQKPNLVHTLFQSEIREKMWSLPVSDLYMCGKSSVESLRNLEILTIGDLAQADPHILTSHLKSHGRLLWDYANGIDNSEVITTRTEAKGIGNSTTLAKDIDNKKEAYQTLLYLSESVSSRLRAEKKAAFMISVEIKYHTFQSASHQKTLPAPCNSTKLLYQHSCELFDELWNKVPIRLIGIRTSKLVSQDAPVQLSLFDLDYSTNSNQKSVEKQRDLDKAIDKIRNKYGDSAVVRGSLLHSKKDYKKH